MSYKSRNYNPDFEFNPQDGRNQRRQAYKIKRQMVYTAQEQAFNGEVDGEGGTQERLPRKHRDR